MSLTDTRSININPAEGCVYTSSCPRCRPRLLASLPTRAAWGDLLSSMDRVRPVLPDPVDPDRPHGEDPGFDDPGDALYHCLHLLGLFDRFEIGVENDVPVLREKGIVLGEE